MSSSRGDYDERCSKCGRRRCDGAGDPECMTDAERAWSNLKSEVAAKDSFIVDLQDQIRSLREVVKYRGLQIDNMRPVVEAALNYMVDQETWDRLSNAIDAYKAKYPKRVECTCTIDGTPCCRARGTGYCLAENPEAAQ